MILTITKENNDLVFYGGIDKMKMYFTTDTDFFILEMRGAEFKFTRDSQNKVDGIDFLKGNNINKIRKVE